MPQDAAHPNARFHEDPAFTKFSVSDPTIFETNVTEHVPIFFFHEDQWRVATAAGAHSTGMRFLAERRALADDCVNRLRSSKHVHRQWNAHADLLVALLS